MSEDNAPLNHGQLVKALRDLCQQKKSGTVLVATHDNNLARILLEDGKIASISFGQKRDKDAIALVREITSCRLKFSEGVAGSHGATNLPDTSTILNLLSAGASGAAGATAVDATLGIIEHELIEVLGPMASLIWGEILEKAGKPASPHAVTLLLQAAAAEIRDPDKRQHFTATVEKKLRG